MDLTLERIVMTEWLYVAVMLWLSIVSFGTGLVIGWLWSLAI